MEYSEPVVIPYNQTRSQLRNEINTHTEHLIKKHNDFALIIYKYLVLNEEKRKQGKKKEKLTESLHLTTTQQHWSQKLHVNKITAETTKWL